MKTLAAMPFAYATKTPMDVKQLTGNFKAVAAPA
jgi:hypothetical protein